MNKINKIALEIFNIKGGRQIQIFTKKNPQKTTLIFKFTKFLKKTTGLIERSYCIINEIFQVPKCKCCANEVKWDKTKRIYKIYCSLSCKGSDIELKQKVKNTVMKNWGVEYISQNDKIKEKKMETCFKNHGVFHPQQNDLIHQKSKETNFNKRGVYYPIQNKKIYTQIKQTLLNNYGVENPSQSPIIQKKIKKNNLIKYNVEHTSQLHISKETLEFLNDKKWLHDQHFIQQKSLTQIAKELNIWDSTIARYLHKHGYETQHFLQSEAEKEIGNFIKSLGYEILTNKRNILPNKQELDIFIPKLNIAFEYNGLFYHSNLFKDKNYHKQKYNMCKKLNIKLFTIFEDEWLHKKNIVKSKITSLLNKNYSNIIYARKTKCITISTIEKNNFFNKFHIQGKGAGSISYGLIYDNNLVACITFIKNINYEYNLNRYATNGLVVGGFSKLLSYFKKNNIWNKIITFADLRWGEGNLYTKCGFKLDKILPPDYSYIENNTIKRIHKFNFRRNKLLKLLNSFDPLLSENQNCYNNNIFKIWNCGLLRYIQSNN